MNLVLRNRNGFHFPIALRRSAYDRPLEQLVDSMFEDFLSPAARKLQPASTAPRIDLSESDAAFAVEAEMPGVAKEDIKISVDGKRVSIEAEVKRTTERKEGEAVVYAERVAKKFVRSFMLSSEVDEARTVAKLENGVLTLTLPKKEPIGAKQITVQ